MLGGGDQEEQWKSWLEQALQQFKELKAKEKALYASLKDAERTDDFACRIKTRQQWFEARAQALDLNARIVAHLGEQPLE